MNQILNTKLKNKRIFSNISFFKVQFFVSITISFILIFFYIINYISIQRKEKISKKLIDNHNISKLYSNNSNYDIVNNNDNNIFGIIEIPKINIYYPIFSNINENLLKISPCKLHGNTLDKNDNICIAAHNYNNSLFFSNIIFLKENDEIYIYNNNGKKYVYSVLKTYEVKSNDMSPIFNYKKDSKELTLITCNNLNLNRIIVKAKQRLSY